MSIDIYILHKKNKEINIVFVKYLQINVQYLVAYLHLFRVWN